VEFLIDNIVTQVLLIIMSIIRNYIISHKDNDGLVNYDCYLYALVNKENKPIFDEILEEVLFEYHNNDSEIRSKKQRKFYFEFKTQFR